MRRLLLSALAVATVSCGFRGSRPLPDAELLRGCKATCPAPNFCAHDGVRWHCLIVEDKASAR